MSDVPPDELAAWRNRLTRGTASNAYFSSQSDLSDQWLMKIAKKLSPARGSALSMVAAAAGLVRRGLLERIPFIGDRWFRRRVQAAIRNRLGPGYGEVRLSAGYESEPLR